MYQPLNNDYPLNNDHPLKNDHPLNNNHPLNNDHFLGSKGTWSLYTGRLNSKVILMLR